MRAYLLVLLAMLALGAVLGKLNPQEVEIDLLVGRWVLPLGFALSVSAVLGGILVMAASLLSEISSSIGYRRRIRELQRELSEAREERDRLIAVLKDLRVEAKRGEPSGSASSSEL